MSFFWPLKGLFLVATASVITQITVANEGKANCFVSKSPVNEGEAVYIICEFSEELPLGTNVIVRRSDLPSSADVAVIRCIWSGSSFEIIEKKDGYEVSDASNGTRLEVLIPYAAKIHEGFYSCQASGYTTPGTKCELQIQEIPYEASCSGLTVSKGSPARVVFFFNKHVLLSQTRFLVTRRPFSSTDVVNIVVDCEGKKNDSCSAFPGGYHIDPSTFSTNVTLNIDSASREQEGIYEVLIQYKFPSKSAPCYVRLTDSKETTPSGGRSTDSQSKDSSDNSMDAGQKDCNKCESSCALATLILVILGFIILLIVLAFIIYNIYKKYRTPRDAENQHELQGLNQDPRT